MTIIITIWLTLGITYLVKESHGYVPDLIMILFCVTIGPILFTLDTIEDILEDRKRFKK